MQNGHHQSRSPAVALSVRADDMGPGGRTRSSCGEKTDDYVVLGDNAEVLPTLPDKSFQLIYIDPPFNTGKSQQRISLVTRRSEDGDRRGFGGHNYVTVETGRNSYEDEFDDYLGFLRPRLKEAHRLLAR